MHELSVTAEYECAGVTEVTAQVIAPYATEPIGVAVGPPGGTISIPLGWHEGLRPGQEVVVRVSIEEGNFFDAVGTVPDDEVRLVGLALVGEPIGDGSGRGPRRYRLAATVTVQTADGPASGTCQVVEPFVGGEVAFRVQAPGGAVSVGLGEYGLAPGAIVTVHATAGGDTLAASWAVPVPEVAASPAPEPSVAPSASPLPEPSPVPQVSPAASTGVALPPPSSPGPPPTAPSVAPARPPAPRRSPDRSEEERPDLGNRYVLRPDRPAIRLTGEAWSGDQWAEIRVRTERRLPGGTEWVDVTGEIAVVGRADDPQIRVEALPAEPGVFYVSGRFADRRAEARRYRATVVFSSVPPGLADPVSVQVEFGTSGVAVVTLEKPGFVEMSVPFHVEPGTTGQLSGRLVATDAATGGRRPVAHASWTARMWAADEEWDLREGVGDAEARTDANGCFEVRLPAALGGREVQRREGDTETALTPDVDGRRRRFAANVERLPADGYTAARVELRAYPGTFLAQLCAEADAIRVLGGLRLLDYALDLLLQKRRDFEHDLQRAGDEIASSLSSLVGVVLEIAGPAEAFFKSTGRTVQGLVGQMRDKMAESVAESAVASAVASAVGGVLRAALACADAIVDFVSRSVGALAGGALRIALPEGTARSVVAGLQGVRDEVTGLLATVTSSGVALFQCLAACTLALGQTALLGAATWLWPLAKPFVLAARGVYGLGNKFGPYVLEDQLDTRFGGIVEDLCGLLVQAAQDLGRGAASASAQLADFQAGVARALPSVETFDAAASEALLSCCGRSSRLEGIPDDWEAVIAEVSATRRADQAKFQEQAGLAEGAEEVSAVIQLLLKALVAAGFAWRFIAREGAVAVGAIATGWTKAQIVELAAKLDLAGALLVDFIPRCVALLWSLWGLVWTWTDAEATPRQLYDRRGGGAR